MVQMVNDELVVSESALVQRKGGGVKTTDPKLYSDFNTFSTQFHININHFPDLKPGSRVKLVDFPAY